MVWSLPMKFFCLKKNSCILLLQLKCLSNNKVTFVTKSSVNKNIREREYLNNTRNIDLCTAQLHTCAYMHSRAHNACALHMPCTKITNWKKQKMTDIVSFSYYSNASVAFYFCVRLIYVLNLLNMSI